MKKIVFSLLLISSVAFSQIEKNVGDFNKVTSFDQIDVLLVPSDENKVVLDGNGANEVEVVNKNGELKIRMPLTRLLDGDNISATVYYKISQKLKPMKVQEFQAKQLLNPLALN